MKYSRLLPKQSLIVVKRLQDKTKGQTVLSGLMSVIIVCLKIVSLNLLAVKIDIVTRDSSLLGVFSLAELAGLL